MVLRERPTGNQRRACELRTRPRATEPAHLCHCHQRGHIKMPDHDPQLLFCTGFLQYHAVLTCDSAQRVEVHRTRITQRPHQHDQRETLHVFSSCSTSSTVRPSALTRTRPVHIMSEFVRLQDLQNLISHDLVVSLFQRPNEQDRSPRCFPRHEIHARDCDMRVGFAPSLSRCNNDIARGEFVPLFASA